MSGIRSSIYALAIAIQADANTPATIDIAEDVFPCANLRPGGQSFTLANPESTGSVHRPGDAVLGREGNDAFDFIMRGPAGSAPPALGEYVPGRVLRGAGFAESVLAAPETGTLGGASDNSGATTVVQLAAGANAADGHYVGMTIQFDDIEGGSGVKSTSQVVAYDGTTKLATLGEKLTTAPASDYTFPPQLLYRLDADAAQLYLTEYMWLDKKLYKRQNGTVNQMQFTLPTSNRGNTAIPMLNCGIQSEIDDDDDEVDQPSPTVQSLGGIPPFRDGKFMLNGVPIPMQSMTYQHGIQVGFPPNPNKPSGADAGCITETRRSVALNLQEVLLSFQDRNALAVAQSEVPLMAQYGNVAGKTVYFCVPAGRLDFSNPDSGGEFVTNSTQMLIDGADLAVCFSFPYFT